MKMLLVCMCVCATNETNEKNFSDFQKEKKMKSEKWIHSNPTTVLNNWKKNIHTWWTFNAPRILVTCNHYEGGKKKLYYHHNNKRVMMMVMIPLLVKNFIIIIQYIVYTDHINIIAEYYSVLFCFLFYIIIMFYIMADACLPGMNEWMSD